jgi:GNAT superfamily N-acetyltransferase
VTTVPRVDLRTVDGMAALPVLDELVAIYKEAFLDLWESDPEQAARDRRLHVRGHLHRAGAVVVTAVDEHKQLLGFTYGAPGNRGGWWHDTVTSRLTQAERLRWVSDCFEVVELHVRPAAQGQGIGRMLLRHLLSTSTASTAALSALDDPELPARKLYTSEGFTLLRSCFTFPGTPVDYAILAVDLPLPEHS